MSRTQRVSAILRSVDRRAASYETPWWWVLLFAIPAGVLALLLWPRRAIRRITDPEVHGMGEAPRRNVA